MLIDIYIKLKVIFLILKDKYILQKANELCIVYLTKHRGGKYMGFFKKKKTEDEWVTQTKNKIYAEMYKVVVYLCAISIVVKLFINGFSDSLYLRNDTELIILLVASLYYLHRSIRLGVYAAETELHDRKSKWSMQKKNTIWSIVAGFGIAAFMGLNSAVNFAEGAKQSVYYFFMVMGGSLIFYLPVMLIVFVAGNAMAKRESERVMEKMLHDGSDGEDDEKY